MVANIKAIEVMGQIDGDGQLHLDESLPICPSRVRVILLFEDSDEISEQEWLRVGARNSAFEFLNEPGEDIYTLADGKPFYDQR
jgi:hypothetical protein